jgi:hypothetical protein
LEYDAGHYHRPDIIVSMSGESWAGLYVNQTDLPSMVAKGKAKIIHGDIKFATALLQIVF